MNLRDAATLCSIRLESLKDYLGARDWIQAGESNYWFHSLPVAPDILVPSREGTWDYHRRIAEALDILESHEKRTKYEIAMDLLGEPSREVLIAELEALREIAGKLIESDGCSWSFETICLCCEAEQNLSGVVPHLPDCAIVRWREMAR